jgi:hypothetical protein
MRYFSHSHVDSASRASSNLYEHKPETSVYGYWLDFRNARKDSAF